MDKKRRTANKVIWVEKWLKEFGSKDDLDMITATKRLDGKWESTLKLPKVEEYIRLEADTEVGAIIKMGEVATDCIKKYLNENKDIKFPSLSKTRNWIIESDEEGNFKSIGMSDAARRKAGEAFLKSSTQSIEAIAKAVEKVKRINGENKGLLIRVYDRTNFPAIYSDRKIMGEVTDRLYKELKSSYAGVTIQIKGSYVIAIGYNDVDSEWEEESYEA